MFHVKQIQKRMILNLYTVGISQRLTSMLLGLMLISLVQFLMKMS